MLILHTGGGGDRRQRPATGGAGTPRGEYIVGGGYAVDRDRTGMLRSFRGLVLILVLYLVMDVGFAKVVELGNPPTNSTSTLFGVRDIAFVLVDLNLTSGMLREYRMNIAVRGKPHPVRLQLWRPAATRKPNSFTLVSDVEFLPFGNGTYRIYPGDNVRVEATDRVGFLSRGNFTSVVYDFLPAAAGTLLIARSFRGLLGAPAIGHDYQFADDTYDTWRFSLGVRIDTDYGVGTLPAPSPTAPPIPPDSETNRELEFRESVDGSDRKSKPSLVWLAIVIPIIYATITCSATIYAIYYIVWKNRKVVLTSYDNPVPVTADNDLNIRRKNIVVRDVISEGHIGTIYHAEIFGLAGNTGWVNASLKMLGETASDHLKQLLLREMESMRSLNSHTNVLQLQGYCLDEDRPVLVVEHVPFGNLRDHLREVSDSSLDVHTVGHNNFTVTSQLVGFGVQIARGMSYLSSMKMLHRGLCARNVLLAEGRVCKVTSFSFIQDVIEHHEYQRVTQSPQPVRWMAPESLSDNIYTHKSDVYSMGVLLWEVITLGSTPYPNLNTSKVIRSVKKGVRMSRPPHCKHELYSLIESCWAHKSSERYSFEVLTHRLEEVHGTNTDLLQLEKYPVESLRYISPADHPLEVL